MAGELVAHIQAELPALGMLDARDRLPPAAWLASLRSARTRRAYAGDLLSWRAWLTERGLELLGAGQTVTASMPFRQDVPADRIVASALARNTAAWAPVLSTMDNTIRRLRTDDRICEDDGNRERTITDLAQAARTGDRAAWDEIVFRYDGVVRATVARYRLQQSDAADATQNTWLRAVERIATIRNPERLGSWLATTAARECLAVLRRARREFPSEASVEIVWAGAGPETSLLQEERNRVIDATVAELPILRRQLVDALFRDPESTYAKVAQLTRMPIGSIGPTRSRVLLELRRRMRRDGFGVDDLVA